MKTTIRRAVPADIDLLVKCRIEVLREVFSIPASQSVAMLEKENREYYRTAIPAGGHIACFAYVDEEIVGCGGVCLYREMPSPDNPNGCCAYLMNIYTRSEFRGQGVGGKIVNWLVRQAKQKGSVKIYLEASESGRSLYEKKGFSAMSGYMQLPIILN